MGGVFDIYMASEGEGRHQQKFQNQSLMTLSSSNHPEPTKKNHRGRRHYRLPAHLPQPPQLHLLPAPQHRPLHPHPPTHCPLHPLPYPRPRRQPWRTALAAGAASPGPHYHACKNTRPLFVLLVEGTAPGSTGRNLSGHTNHTQKISKSYPKQAIDSRCVLTVTNPYRDAHMHQRFTS